MKKLIIISILLVFSSSFAIAQNSSTPLGLESKTLSLSISGSVLMPVVGNYNQTLKINDILETGPSFGVSVNYSLSSTLSIRGAYDYAYNYFKSNFRTLDKKPAFHVPMITTDLILKFGSLIKENNFINPYCFSGVGVYFWEFSKDGTCLGNVMNSSTGREWKDTSFELHTGLGTEIYINSNFAFFAEGQFRYIFSKNTNDFGNEFENLGFIKITGGLTYYF